MKTLRITAFLLLAMVGVSALYGGFLLMLDPTGGMIRLPFHWIQNSPFTDYFFPGLILFISNGILSVAAAVATLIQWKVYSKMIYMQGCIIVGWIVTQMIMLKLLFWLQFVIGGMGITLMILGITLNVWQSKKQHA